MKLFVLVSWEGAAGKGTAGAMGRTGSLEVAQFRFEFWCHNLPVF